VCQPLLLWLLVFFLAAASSAGSAQDTPEAVEKELNTPSIRGGATFKARCGSCHGERGDGTSPLAKRHPELQAEIAGSTAAYYNRHLPPAPQSTESIPREHKLSAAEIADVVAYLQIVGDPVRRGEIVYKSNCILCHGINADGKGRASPLYHPPPADLTHTNKNDDYKRAIIRFGGSSLGRSSRMPPWNGRITDTELQDLLEYLRAISNTPSHP
jgi:mono/diheme cytochrome c family protein